MSLKGMKLLEIITKFRNGFLLDKSVNHQRNTNESKN